MVIGVAIAAVGAIILGAPAAVAAVVAAIVAAVATAIVLIKNTGKKSSSGFRIPVKRLAISFRTCGLRLPLRLPKL